MKAQEPDPIAWEVGDAMGCAAWRRQRLRGEQRLELNICLRSKRLPGRPLPAQLWHTLTYSGHAMFGYKVGRARLLARRVGRVRKTSWA